MVIEAGACRRLSQLLRHENVCVQTPALRTVGNMILGDDIQTQILINAGTLDSLMHIIRSKGRLLRTLRKDACWVVSNILAGTAEHIQAAIDANLVQMLVSVLHKGSNDAKREACWALCNATVKGSPAQILHMVRCNMIPKLVAMVIFKDPKIELVAMDGIENVLRASAPLVELSLVPAGYMLELCHTHKVPDILLDAANKSDDSARSQKAKELLAAWFTD